MLLQEFIVKYPHLEDLARLIVDEIRQATRPANEIIYDDVDLRNYLKVSKRTTAQWREDDKIINSKIGGKIFYKLSNILKMIDEHEVPTKRKKLKLTL